VVASLLTNKFDAPKPLRDINGDLVDMRHPLGIGDLSEEPKVKAKQAYT
jgi:hypothetical protein